VISVFSIGIFQDVFLARFQAKEVAFGQTCLPVIDSTAEMTLSGLDTG